jgi:filamentous hemagglutinin family protein
MNNVIQQSQTGKKTQGVFFFRLWIGFLIYLMGGFPTLVFALPQDGEIVSGQGSIDTSGSDMVVHQASDKLIANWQSFSIGSGESVEFRQPSASSVALNNVIGLSPSVILGSLKANGQVFLSNGSGVIFGQGAQVNVGGLLATTLGITNEDFLAGDYNFTQDASRPLSSVINRGLIEASYVGLLAPGVENTGTIVANLGSVNMASGKAASLDFVGDGLINFAITEAVDGDVLDDEGNVIDHRVKNAGLIQADGGRVVLSAKDAGNIIQNVVNNEGIIEAHSAVEKNGEIFLMGGDSGVVANSGTLDASGKESGQTGGTVHMVGEKVGVFGEGVVDVLGNAGGGTALIGGDVQGGGDVQTASNTYVSEDATITADAIENGDGGKVVVWADDTTRVYGSISATGGALSGNGGFVETSGKNFLEVTRAADVTAAFGLGGEWLIDPRDITIVAGNGNTGINSSNPFVSTGDSSILGVDLIIAALTGGANVTITTGSDGAQAGDITLNTDLDFNGTGSNTLSFIAHNDIILNNSILDSSAGGDTLNLVFTADSDLSGSGNLVVNAGASVDSQGGSMQITAHDVDIQGTLDAGAGDVAISIAQTGADQIQIGDAAFCPTCAMVIDGSELENITAANLTVENSSDDIYVDSISAANSNNIGTVILDAGGNVEIGRNSDETIAPINSSVFNALTILADEEILIREHLETDTGDLTLTADADSSGGVDDWITFRSTPNLVSAGDITMNGSASAAGIRTLSFGALVLDARGSITFNDEFFGMSYADFTADNGIYINANFSSSVLDLDGNANGLADGIDRIVFADGITVESYSTLGSIIFHEAEALGSITLLSGSEIDLLGDFTANGTVSINADTATSVGLGLLTITNGATLNTNNNTLSIIASDVDIQGNINTGSADVTVSMALSIGQIALGDSTLCATCAMKFSGAELENITASTLTVENTSQAIFVDNVTADNSNNIGSVTLDSGKHIVFQGNASTFNGLTASATTDMDVRVDVTTDTGDLILTGDSDTSGGADRFKVFNNSVLTSAGDMTLTHTGLGGTIEVASIGVMTAGGTLTLGSNLTAGFHSTMSANDGININGNLTAWGDINLNGDANSIADGNDTITFANGIVVYSTNRSVTFDSATSALGAITVQAASDIDINDTFLSAGLTTFNADNDSNGVGDFTVGATGSVSTNNNALSINAGDFDFQGTLNAGALGDIVLSNSLGKINLGDSTLCPTCAAQISGVELQNLTAATLTLDSTADAIFVDNVSAADSNNVGMVTLTAGKHIVFQGNASTFNGLTASATTDMDVRVDVTTDTGNLILTGDSDTSGGADRFKVFNDAVLNSAGDMTLTLNGGAGTISSAGAATMVSGGSININGAWDVDTATTMTAGGSIDVTGALNVNGSMTVTSGGTMTLGDIFASGATATFNADDGINVNGNFIATGNVALDGDANSIVDGNDTITLANGITVESTTGGVTFGSAASALGAITVLAANGIDVNGTFSSLGLTTFNADNESNGVGDFTVGAEGSVNSNNNAMTINARDVDLQGTLSAGALGSITLEFSGAGQIALGDSTLCPNCAMQISGSELQNITAGTFTVNNSDNAIFVDNVSAANSNTIGMVALNSAKHIAFQGNASTFNGLTASATTDMDVRVDVTTDTGDLILTGDSDTSGGADRFKVFNDAVLNSAGDMTLTLNGGAGTIEVASIAVMTAGGTLTLDGDFTAGFHATLSADNGINLNGNFTAWGDISLNGDANSFADGNDTVTLAIGSMVESTNRSVTFDSATSALGAITILAADGIDINDAFTSLGLTTLNANSDANSSGDFTVSATGSVSSNNNALSISANDILLTGTLNAGTSDVILLNANNGTIGLGNTAGDMTIDGSELQKIFASTLALGSTTNGDVTVDGITAIDSDNFGTVTLNSGGDINFSNNDSVFNALTVNANNDINVNTNLETDTGSINSVADADLNSAGNFNLAGGTTMTSAVDIDITAENVNLNGNLVAGGTITINGVVFSGGNITIQAVDGIILTDDVFNNGNITIDADTDRNGVGNFEIVAGKFVKSFDNNISITANDFIISGFLDAGTGTLTLLSSVTGSTIGLGNATGDIVISGAELQNITAATLNIGSPLLAGAPINSGINVDGVTAADIASIGAVSLNSDGNIDFVGSDSTFATLDLFAEGNITTTGVTLIGTDLTTVSGTGMNISTQVDSLVFNNFLSGDVTVNNVGALALRGDGATGGSLFLTAGGDITSTGALRINQAINIDATGFDITLDNSLNFNTGVVSVSGKNVSLADFGSIDLGASTITGNLIVNVGGNINNSGALSVAGTTDLISNGSVGITLDNPANDFNGTVTAVGVNVTLVDSDDITIGASTVTGALFVTAANGITVDGAITTSGLTSFNADSDGNSNGNFSVTALGSLQTNNNDLSIISRDIDLQGAVDAGNVLLSISGTGQVMLGDDTSCPACAMKINGSELQNITTGTLTIDNSAEAIFVDNISAANSDNIGAVILNSARHVAISGNASTFNALTVNAKAAVEVRVNLTTDTGDLILNADTDSTGGTDRIFFAVDPTLTSAGDITLNSSSGAPGIDASGSVTMVAGGTISLNDDFTAGNNATLSADNGINVNGDFTAGKIINLDGDANSSADGNDTITFADGVTLASTSSSVTLGQTVALGLIILNARDGITLTGDFTSNATTTIDADTGVAFGTGTFAVASGATLNTNNNTLSINALDIDLQGNVNVGSSNMIISIAQASGTQGQITLGDNTICPTCAMQISGSELQNITAGTLTIENTAQAIFVDNITAANSDNLGNVILNSEKHIRFLTNASTFNTLTVNAKAGVDVYVGLATDTGDLILNADTDSTGGVDHIFFRFDPTLTSAANIVLSTSGGANIDAEASVTMVAAGTITLSDDFTAGGGATLTADDGINVNGAFTATDNIILNGDANSSVDGNDTVTFASGITVESTAGSISFDSGTSALGAITVLAANGIDINDAFTSLGTTTFNSDSDANGTGTFTVASTGSLSSSFLVITADDVDLAGTVSATSKVSIRISDGGTIGIGNAVGDMSISGAELQNLTSNVMEIGLTGNSKLTADGVTLADVSNFTSLSLNSAGEIEFAGAASNFNYLTVIADGPVNVNAAVSTQNRGSYHSDTDINVNADLESSADISVYSDASIFTTGAKIISAGSMDIRSGVGVNISTETNSLFLRNTGTGDMIVNNSGDLFITVINSGNVHITNTGTVSQGTHPTNSVNVFGTFTVNAAGFDVTLANTTNEFGGTVNIDGANVALVDQNSIDFGTSTITGNLDVTAVGSITQSGALSVTGMTMISAIGNDVTLNNASNDFVGEVGIDANNVSITDTNTITFKASTLTGGLTVNANDGVTVNGTVSTGAASAINADSDANGSGTFAVTAAGSILTNNNTLSITADDIDLQGTLNAGLSDITVLVSDNGTIGLGNTAGDMTIDGSELQNITAANLILGSTTNGNVTVDGISAANSDNIGMVTINSGGNIDFSNNDSVFNALNVHAVTDINVNTNLETDTGNFVAIADFENNTIGDFNLGTGTTLTSALDIDITAENVNLNGDMVSGGTITINGEIFADDPISLYAVDGIIITEDINNNESITIDADTNRDGIGDFELVGGVLIKSNDYDISITANDFIINGTIDAGTGNVILFSSVGGSIGIGEATGDIEIDNSKLQNITAGNLNIGDALNGHIRVKNVQAVDVANIAKMTLNATKAGKSVIFEGTASNLNDLTVNASNDVKVEKGLTAKETSLNAGDDVKLKGNLNFDSLNAVAGDDIHAHGTLTVTDDGNLNAGDDIHLHGDNSFEALNAIAGDDIHAHGTLTVTGGGNLNAGDDIHLHGDNSFETLNVSAVDDIKIHDALTVVGNTFMTAGDDIDMRGTFNLGDWAAVASDDIKLRGDFNISIADLKADDEIKIEKAEINSGNFSAEADFDNNGKGAFKLDRRSSITSSGDIGLSGYGLKIKGSLSAAGTLTLTDKSE